MKLRHSLILPIVTLSSLSLLLSSVSAQTSSATCPMDLNYVPRIPWNSSVCHNHSPSQDYTERDPCCKTVWAVFNIALAQRLKDTSLFMLPNLPTSISCLQDFQSKLTSLSLPSDIVSRCIDPMQTVITPNMCAGIESTQDVVAKLGDVTDLSYCSRPDLTDLPACNACVNAGVRAEAELLPIARNSTHDTECSHFLLLYSAGIVNRFGLMTDGSLSCIIGLSLTRGIDSSNYPGATDETKHIKKIIIVAVIIGITIFAVCIFFLWKCTAKCKEIKKQGKGMLLINRRRNQPIFSSGNDVGEKINVVKLQDLPLFSIQDLAIATNSFHLQNKLGDGGFGPVYKGVLQNGQKIAVKRLSRASGQGLDEFMNEVLVVSKLQHRNLVRLLGCCVEKDENLLVYEYMPNNSLDTFLFDPRNQELLDWRTRFKIIEGISRGLLYLHRDSRLKIIHRDLKASNILLDEELNPKISDFGIARIFRGNEDHANTDRVVGTYGYMPPEYAMAGKFSEKSDMFSFGVLLLEIITGRSTSFFNNDESLTLLGFVWKQWNEDNVSALIDKVTSDPSCHGEVLRCIHVGLLCVQESAEERPAISTVCSMLSREIMDLPPPKQPAFVERIIATEMATTSVDGRKTFFPSNLTVTIVEGR